MVNQIMNQDIISIKKHSFFWGVRLRYTHLSDPPISGWWAAVFCKLGFPALARSVGHTPPSFDSTANPIPPPKKSIKTNVKQKFILEIHVFGMCPSFFGQIKLKESRRLSQPPESPRAARHLSWALQERDQQGSASTLEDDFTTSVWPGSILIITTANI